MTGKIFALVLGIAAAATAQGQQADTVIVPLGKTSKVIFTMGDRSDLEILKHYNFQDLFNDIFKKIEESDSTKQDTTEAVTAYQEKEENRATPDNDEEEDDDEWSNEAHYRRGRIGRTWQSTNMDFGINNYLATDQQFPDGGENHSVRPWGSWYIGINSVQRTKAGRNFFIEWGFGVSWYNFKFQNDNVGISKTPESVNFTAGTNPEFDYIKSKLRVTHLNASLIPVLDFGDRGRKPRMWDSHGSEFRIGLGPYVGYKIGSKSKMVFKDEDNDRKKDKTRDSFYLNDLRYGARLQIGFRSTDLFFNYDFNELFKEGKGPGLNAISFGVIF